MKRFTDKADYQGCYQAALEQPETYWTEVAKSFEWIKPFVRATPPQLDNFEQIEWFKGAKLNVTQNALDRHVKKTPDKIAIYFEPNSSSDSSKRSYTYLELYLEVCRMAETLRKLDVKKGDTVTLYMGMNADLLISVLACARIGAIHSVVFGGFSANALSERISDAQSKIVITQEQAKRGDKILKLRETVDEALKLLDNANLIKAIVFGSMPQAKAHHVEVEKFWSEHNLKLGMNSPIEAMDAEDPLFILYTSGSTGQPKGLVHTTAGYMLWAQYSFEQVFGVDKDKDVFWCTADIGWVTGHSYVAYGPLLAGVTQVLYEGIPTYPDAARWWNIIDNYQVTHFYTAPTAIRSLESIGTKHFEKVSLNSLKVLGSVGEPINVEAWEWYNQHVGKSRCPIVDTWWQTETGGILISSMANISECIATMATYPLPGIYPALMNEKAQLVTSIEGSGNLVITRSWPGLARSIWRDRPRYLQTYFSAYPGMYFTGDGSNRDREGRYRITGRVDDVINVSGHRLSTAEIENAINETLAIVESAVVGMPHAIKGQAVLAYVLLNPEDQNNESNQELLKLINDLISQKIGPIAKVDKLIVLTQLPKTRSGKIMRRILRKAAEGEWNSIGDTSTLLNPEIVDELKEKLQRK